GARRSPAAIEQRARGDPLHRIGPAARHRARPRGRRRARRRGSSVAAGASRGAGRGARRVRARPAPAAGRSGRTPVGERRLTADSGYEDVLDLEFIRPHDADSGLLVLTGVNTALSSAVYSFLCRVVGGQAALLAHAVETDPELIAQLRRYLRDASLEVRLWD